MTNISFNSKPPRILVLLACYNGEKYIEEQIKSILQQKDVDLDILISDDGSSDSTLNIVKSINAVNIAILASPHPCRSAAQNFLKLLSAANVENYDFISLSDQDDIWNTDKLIGAIETINGNKGVNFYSSNVTAFWENGKKILVVKSQPQTKYDYLFEPAGPGCTYVFTRNVAKQLQDFISHNDLNKITMHDWFIYAWARHNSHNWVIDNASSMMYRQHEINVVGSNVGLKAALARLKKIRNGWYRSEILNLAKILEIDNAVIQLLRSNKVLDKISLMTLSFSFRRRLRDKFALLLLILIMR